MSTNVNVRDERQFNHHTFGEIGYGSWFVDEYGNLYCKLNNGEDENALCATSGDLEEFAPNEFAQPIKKLTFILEE